MQEKHEQKEWILRTDPTQMLLRYFYFSQIGWSTFADVEQELPNLNTHHFRLFPSEDMLNLVTLVFVLLL